MASNYNSLGMELMITGENAGTWGDKTNTNLDLIQEGWGYLAIDVAASDVTLVMSSGASSNARNFIIELTGTLAGNRALICPKQAGSPAANIEKGFLVIDKTNRSGSNFSLTFKTTGETGVLIPANSNIFCYHNGTDIFTSGMLSTRGSAATLAAQPTYTIPSADGTTGQYLKTDGSGALTFATLPAAGISTGVAIAMAIVFG